MNEKPIATAVAQLKEPYVQEHVNFFTFEGGEGSGKSTILSLVAERLKKDGLKVFATREPGGTGSQKAEAIRGLIYEPYMEDMAPLTEAFLYAASRAQHVDEIIAPRLQEQYIVLCDRYVDSSLVYQGMQRNNLTDVVTINKLAIKETMPKTTFFFDVPPEVGLARVKEQRSDDTNYIDHKDISFHREIYESYSVLAKEFAERYVRIDAEKDIEAVVDDVYTVIKTVIGRNGKSDRSGK